MKIIYFYAVIVSFFFLSTQCTITKGSKSKESLITHKSYMFFCDSIMKNDMELAPLSIYFSGYANTTESYIFNIVDCYGYNKIIEGNKLLDQDFNRILKEEQIKERKKMKLKVSSSIFLLKYKTLLTPHYLQINAPLEYNGYIYQQYIIINRNVHLDVIFQIDVDSLEILDYCKMTTYVSTVPIISN